MTSNNFNNKAGFKDSPISTIEDKKLSKYIDDTSKISEKYNIDPKLLDQPIEQHIASEIVASPFWHPCKFCGHLARSS